MGGGISNAIHRRSSQIDNDACQKKVTIQSEVTSEKKREVEKKW